MLVRYFSCTQAVDEHTVDAETSQHTKVALKLMRVKAQYLRELSARDNKDFSPEYVMNVLQTDPLLSMKFLTSSVDVVTEDEADVSHAGQFTKANAEKLFLLVMPLVCTSSFV